MKTTILAVVATLITATGFTQPKKITKSEITFKIRNLGINTGGSLGTPVADINFDPQKLASSSIVATVDVATIDTKNDKRDKHLKSADYFDVEKYPKITMKSVSFKHNSGDNYTGKFNVTIKDKTQLITVPFTYTESASASFFKGEFKIKRSNFGIGGSSMILSDEATVTVSVDVSK